MLAGQSPVQDADDRRPCAPGSSLLYDLPMTESLSFAVSVLALAISIVTAWLTLFRRGELKMTQPTVVFLGPDGGAPNEGPPRLKVFLRTLLFSTSVRGQIVESMHVNVQRGETRQNFSIWVYGDKQLSRGSGLHVGPEGVACNHHFLLPEDGASFRSRAWSVCHQCFCETRSGSPAKALARRSSQHFRDSGRPTEGSHLRRLL